MERIACKDCGDMSFFLRVKGPQTGIYCSSCGKWNKWINKKDLNVLKRQGMPVHPEDYNPELTSQIIEKARQEANSYNLGLVEEENNSSPAPIKATLGNKSLSIEEIESYVEEVHDLEPCPVCASGCLESITPVDDIEASVFKDILFIRSKDHSKMYGSFKITFCPGCGVKLV